MSKVDKKEWVGIYLSIDGETEIRLPLKERPNCILLAIESKEKQKQLQGAQNAAN